MANYTAADVKRLRELTGSGMMDCKNALADNDGDFDKAVEYLRIKGAKDVGKRAERSTAEGLVASSGGVIIEINCETDFVAKNDQFQDLANRIVAVAAAGKPADVEALNALELDGSTVGETVQAMSAKIGEKLELRRVAVLEGNVATYMHKRSTDLPPAVGVLVAYTGDGDTAAEAAKAAAMQVAAMKARYTTRDEVPEEIVATERRIAEETAREEGKPEQALPKIIEGRVNGFFKDAVLLEQASVTDSKKTVKAVLDAAGAAVTGFVRFEVGQA
ncbi:translation elongation factor Ts [Tomitella biformata]|uniref:translation elongation factor Ts n=1 Tax=Tomitella biformata TaxID=630403 RepID=UPI0004652B86|nr:translation elongation factor Ts [Tomitella biformata]